MPGLDLVHACQALGTTPSWPLLAGVPLAYIGPGADLSLLSYALTLIGFAVTAISAVLLWPFYTFLRWVRGKKAPPPAAAPDPKPEESHADRPSES
jgi:hypothetical protein